VSVAEVQTAFYIFAIIVSAGFFPAAVGLIRSGAAEVAGRRFTLIPHQDVSRRMSALRLQSK
jgi:hypothetical protein